MGERFAAGFAAGGGISAQAQARIDAFDPTEFEAFDAQDFQAHRQEAQAIYEPRAKAVLSDLGLAPKTISIAGVDCLETTPKNWDGARQLLYFYGGGYVTGSAFQDQIVAAQLAAQTGARVIAPCYRLAPEAPFPAAINDGFAVYAQMAGCPVVGESAGGNLALVTMLRARAKGLELPSVCALLSPWCDLTDAPGDSILGNDGRDPSLSAAMLAGYVMHYTGGHDARDPLVSPLYGGFDEQFPPTIITSGTRDLLLSQAVRLSRVLLRAGVRVDLNVWEGLGHVFEFDPSLPEAQESLQTISAFILRHFRGHD